MPALCITKNSSSCRLSGRSNRIAVCAALPRWSDGSSTRHDAGAYVTQLKHASIAALASAFISSLGNVDPAWANTVIQGKARAVDGDTLVVEGQRIRFYGVDAPESAQQCLSGAGKEYACGLVAKDALAKAIGEQAVRCDVKNTDQYGRSVSVCYAGATELNKFMVDNGYAVAYRQYSKEYVPMEEQAKAAGRGVWQGTFTYPADWRKENKRKEGTIAPAVPAVAAPAAAGTAATAAAAAYAASAPAALPASLMAASLASSFPSGVALGSAASSLVGNLASPPAPAVPSCLGVVGTVPGGFIKGNINSGGEKIYHKPGGRYYDKVVIDIEDGERYFCTEAEAKAAGWRPSAQ